MSATGPAAAGRPRAPISVALPSISSGYWDGLTHYQNPSSQVDKDRLRFAFVLDMFQLFAIVD